MSSVLRNFMEAYTAVHNPEAKEEFYASRDSLSELDFSLINEEELNDICEEIVQELFEEGCNVTDVDLIVDGMLSEAKVTYGSDTDSPRAMKVKAIKTGLKGAMDKVKSKASTGAVKTYGAYRTAKVAAQDKARRTSQTAKNMSAQTARAAVDAKAKAKSGIKGMLKKAAEKVSSGAQKVAKRMSEGAKPDYLDFDKDRNKKESMKKALEDKKKHGMKGHKCDDDCDEKMEEGYKELPKNKMFRKAGNLGREVVSPSTTDEKRQKSYDRSKKIVKTLNKANEEVSFSETELKKFEEIVNSWID